MMAACSNDELVEKTDNNGVDGKETEWHANVRLVLPSVAGAKTRAAVTDPEFNDGKEEEYHINPNECYFEAFDEKKHRIGAASGADINWSKDETETDNVTWNGSITIHSSLKPKYVVCFLNLPQNLVGNISSMNIEGLKTAKIIQNFEGTKEAMASIFARVSESNKGFFMTNSSYFDSNNNKIQEVDVENYIYEQGEAAKLSVTIHVERVVAKVTADVNLTTDGNTIAQKVELTDGSVFYKLTCKNETGGIQTDVTYGVKFLHWSLNATNRSFLPLKKIVDSKNEWDFEDYGWNSSTNGRSYWAIDGNYDAGDGEYLDNQRFDGTTAPANLCLNYYSLNQTNNTLGKEAAEYCFENTLDGNLTPRYGKATHVIFKAQYTDKDGKVEDNDVYRLGKGIYTEDALKTYVVALLKPHIVGFQTLTPADIALERNDKQFKDRTDVKAIIRCTNTNVQFQEGVDKENLGKTIFADRHCWVYPKGLCYYTIPIKHFSKLNLDHTGHFGVVRNHWYQVKVTDILEFGHPADPDKPIVPEEIEDDEWLLNCDIKVLAWGKVDVDASVGDNSGWQ